MKVNFNGRLIRKGPITKGPRILVEVANQKNESASLADCTCELCRNPGTHTQTIPGPAEELHK